jgi:hypothetical protein
MTEREQDMHYRNAAAAFDVPLDEVTREQRAFAKFCAFGARSEGEALKLLLLGLRAGTQPK